MPWAASLLSELLSRPMGLLADAVVQLLVAWVCTLQLCISALGYLLAWRGSRRCNPPPLSGVTTGTISIVIPAYNEATSIARTLGNLEATTADRSRVNIVVVDAGCTDNTLAVCRASAKSIPITYAKSTGGRGPALNEGARVADGEILMFLHADTLVPPQWDELLRRELRDAATLMTCFKFGVDRDSFRGRVPPGLATMELCTNVRVRLFQLPYGDQALAMSSTTFNSRGGFPPTVLLEDYGLVTRLRRDALGGGGRIRVIHAPALCNGRRWEMNGVFKNTALNQVFILAHAYFGATPQQVFDWYYTNRWLEWARF